MPIFVSRFSAERVAGGGLGRVRNQRETERRANARETDRTDRTDRTEQSDRGRGPGRGERSQDQLPAATQAADALREQIRNRTSPDDSDARTRGRQQEATRETLPTQATLPGVRTVSSRARASATAPQVGRLGQDTESPAIQATLDRFESLRNARPATTGNARSAEVRQAFRDIPSEAQSFAGLQARQLNAQVNASIRLLRNGATDTAQPEQERPNAEEISRANTSPEIQQNLREDSSEIQRGLRVDAEIQSQQNLRQTAETAGRASEARRESRINSNDQAVRELNVQERQLERGLRNTQREIRDLTNENNRLQSSASNATASTAANLANRTTLVT